MERVREIIEKDIRDQKKLRAMYIRQLKKIEKLEDYKFGLCSYEKNGKSYYAMHKGGRRVHLGRGANTLVQRKQLHFLLNMSLDRLERNIMEEKKILKVYQETDLETIAEECPKCYKDGIELLAKAGAIMSKSKWANEPYERSQRYPEHLNQTARNGMKMRSKSEVLIANALLEKGIPFRYEEITWIEGHNIAPDFKILIEKDGRIIIWEHIGLTSDEYYKKSFLWKLDLYISNGYVIGENLILTFDSNNGNLDSRTIEKTINNFIM